MILFTKWAKTLSDDTIKSYIDIINDSLIIDKDEDLVIKSLLYDFEEYYELNFYTKNSNIQEVIFAEYNSRNK